MRTLRSPRPSVAEAFGSSSGYYEDEIKRDCVYSFFCDLFLRSRAEGWQQLGHFLRFETF
jgi:hypothetical protein